MAVTLKYVSDGIILSINFNCSEAEFMFDISESSHILSGMKIETLYVKCENYRGNSVLFYDITPQIIDIIINGNIQNLHFY